MSETDDQRLVRLETSHRIKNQLSLVSAMLELSANEAATAEATRQLRSAADRVRAVATVHRLLLDQDEDGTVPIDTMLGELCDALDQIYPSEVSFDGRAAAVRLPGDTAVRLAMIVSESVGSACALAADGSPDEPVRVSSNAEGGALTISMPPGPDRAGPDTYGRVGTLIVDGFARQIGATYTGAATDTGTGTEIGGPDAAALRLSLS